MFVLKLDASVLYETPSREVSTTQFGVHIVNVQSCKAIEEG